MNDKKFGTCSAHQIDKCGKNLINNKNDDQSLKILNKWRANHNGPLITIKQDILRYSVKLGKKPLLVSRIKRMESILEKLKANKDMKLSRIQDIGGCRLIVNDTEDLFEINDMFMKNKINKKIKKTKNYILNPTKNGYRGIHLIYEYNNNKYFECNNCQIEIQLRTKLQHIWATTVEVYDIITKNNIKHNDADEDSLRYFSLMSSFIAKEEDTPIVPDTPDDLNELITELLNLNKKLGIEKILEQYNVITKRSSNNSNDEYCLLDLSLINNDNKRPLNIMFYRQFDKAMEKYQEIEQNNSDNNVVLVSIKDIKNLKKAYPNYFLDSSDFIKFIKDKVKRE
ncbi:RelA/SpoT domain-containing protein [Oxyplasma meridianum]|uniref:RelA/SpoT domain-containing protein n=1 Tax=Oxyplasma meridianum TaxID=3073602 RepID=A0AAX4NJC3_9ARCH